MKDEHKKLIEFIISEFKKEDNGRLLKSDFTKLIEESTKRDLIGRFIFEELFLAEVKNAKYLILTIDGWKFTSFKDIEAKKMTSKIREEAELENTISSTKVDKWLLKTKWYPLIISIITALVSIYFGLKDTSKTNELEQRILRP